jgi:hypothetical protein
VSVAGAVGEGRGMGLGLRGGSSAKEIVHDA